MNESKRVVAGCSAMIVALVAVIVVALFWLQGGGGEGVAPKAPANPSSDSRETTWLNVKEAQYVGNQKCVECHEDQHQSYLATAHSKALGVVDSNLEPSDDEFLHAASQRTYKIYRGDDGKLRHRESLLDENGETLAQQDHALDWLIGSGVHSRSYLVEMDGFLLESPVTWYEQKKQWKISPGYDHPEHWGFERPIDRGCLYCHVGLTEPARDGYHKLKIKHAAISCERCHGPGSLHIAERKKDRQFDAVDRTIVNPAHLSRERREDICAQCHLRGAATVTVQGKDLTDFRPGLRLDDIRIDFRVIKRDAPMTVVGHVEQMRLSKCYSRSSKMTCTTCHDPHDNDKSPIRFQQACLKCHESENCAAAIDHRERQAQNRCVTCHMPQTPTDIPHIAFTHHRIGVHAKNPESPEQVAENALPQFEAADNTLAELMPLRNMSHLSRWQQERLRSLAYFEFAANMSDPTKAKQYRRIAQEGLEALVDQAAPDAEIDAALARIYWEDNPETARHAALHALTDPNISDGTRVSMLHLLGDVTLRLDKPAEALDLVDDLIALRRHSQDYLLKGTVLLALSRNQEALQALLKAEQINPFREDVHLGLAETYGILGKRELADKHDQLAKAIKKAARRKTNGSGR